MTKILHEKCLYPNDIIHEIGTPRNDIFFNERPDILRKVRKHFGITDNCRIILYAPTFRKGGDFAYYNVDINKIKEYFERRSGLEYIIMVRLHPNLLKNEKLFYSIFNSDAINASSYPDMIDLLYASDLLVTDYSSCMFDFMYSYKPIILYVPDRLTYDRGFYMDIDKLPFLIVNDNSELISKLSTYDEVEYKESLRKFMDQIGSVEDGKATQNLYELLKLY